MSAEKNHPSVLQKEKLMGVKRIKMLNTFIDVLNIEQTVDEVKHYLAEHRPLHLMGVNADKINMMSKNKRLKQIVNSCGIINADGASIILAGRFLGKPLPERVAGVDLMMELVKLASSEQHKIFLLGAKQEIVEKTAEVLQKKYPSLDIAGIRNGYFKREQWDDIAEQIKDSRARIVFVGISSPLKEYIIDYFLNEKGINCIFMGVGGSFDVISGAIRRAPLWMRRLNLEWLFRFLQEPVRLFHRYFIGNWQFVIAVAREKRKGKNESFNDRR